jgi:YD repeat-containing protein
MTAINPESGTISYSYFDSGDLYQKTDARGITATMAYDPLHRILAKSYSNSTPPVTYEYYLKDTSSPQYRAIEGSQLQCCLYRVSL